MNRVLKRSIGLILAGFSFSMCALYLTTPSYQFPPSEPFAGPSFWNPYESFSGEWRQVNLHAHAWGFFHSGPDGSQDLPEVLAWYRSHGYAFAAVANHQRIAQEAIPIYEHGYGLGKQHLLALGASGVSWLDLPFWKTASDKQSVIDRVHASASLVAIAHPAEEGAFSDADFRVLTNFELIEVVNGKSFAQSQWDAALSSGRAVWAIGSDDSHDITDSRQAGSAWTMIDASPASVPDMLDALRAGRAYAVEGQGGRTDVRVQAVRVVGNTLHVELRDALATVTFIGQDGRTLKVVPGTSSAEYELGPDDTYVRTTVRSDGSILFLNPVIRYSGSLPRPRAVPDAFHTWVFRIVLVGGAGCGLMLAIRLRRRHRIGVQRRA